MGATARVTVTLEIDAISTWGDDCKVGQVRRQAKDHALQELRRLCDLSRYRIKLIGEPKMTVITFSEPGK